MKHLGSIDIQGTIPPRSQALITWLHTARCGANGSKGKYRVSYQDGRRTSFRLTTWHHQLQPRCKCNIATGTSEPPPKKRIIPCITSTCCPDPLVVGVNIWMHPMGMAWLSHMWVMSHVSSICNQVKNYTNIQWPKTDLLVILEEFLWLFYANIQLFPEFSSMQYTSRIIIRTHNNDSSRTWKTLNKNLEEISYSSRILLVSKGASWCQYSRYPTVHEVVPPQCVPRRLKVEEQHFKLLMTCDT